MSERLRSLRDDERGTTLIEIAVTLVVLGVVMAMFMTSVSSMQTAAGRQEARVRINDVASLALSQLDREIRSGNVLYDPGLESNAGGDVAPGMSLRIYTQADAPNRNPGNQCSQWRITNGTLQTRRWSNVNPNASVTPWWTVATDVVNRTVSPTVPAFTLDSTAAYGSRIMRIALLIDRNDTGGAAPARFDLSITGRNTQYYDIDTTTVCSVVPAY